MLGQFPKHEQVISSNINELITNICDNFLEVKKED
jgi:hypothetical protein